MTSGTARTRSVPAPGAGAAARAPNAAALLRRNAADPAIADRPAMHFGDQRVDPRASTSPSRAVGQPVPRPPADGRAAARRRAARQHARLPVRARRRGARRAPRSSASTTPAATSTCCATSSTPTRPASSPSRATRRCSSRSPIGCPPVLVSHRFADADDPEPSRSAVARRRARPASPADDPGLEPDVDTIWALIFTSGTSDAPEGGDLHAAPAAGHRQPDGR